MVCLAVVKEAAYLEVVLVAEVPTASLQALMSLCARLVGSGSRAMLKGTWLERAKELPELPQKW
jgi:hypothetical protein